MTSAAAREASTIGACSTCGPQDVRVPSVLLSGAMILIVKLALSTLGFARVVRWIRAQVGPTPPNGATTRTSLAAVERAVAMAGALFPGRALCLEQSLVLYFLLRRQQIPVTYCQGVQPHPFQAHAWVEYGGHPLNDVEEHAHRFARFPAVLS
jgi:hypothetical protein